MGVYDQAARFAAQAEPGPVIERVLAPAGGGLQFREWLDTRTIPLPGGPDRIADLVAALDGPTPADAALLVLEFQSRHDPDKLDVSLEEAAILRGHARHGAARELKYRVLTALVYLQGECPSAVLEMTLPGGFGTRHAPLVWNVSGDGAGAALDAVESGRASAGLLYWTALMAGGGTEETIARWREVVSRAVPTARARGNMAGITLVFAELVGNRPMWVRGLEGFDVTESQVVNEWIGQGLHKGELNTRRQDLLELLNGRFSGAVPPEVTRLIQTQESLELLHDWFRAAVRAYSFEQFMEVVRR